MEIRKLRENEAVPMDLLLLADPSTEIVQEYVERGSCYVLEDNEEIVGIYVLLPTRPETVELVNVAVAEANHGKGLGKRLVLHAISEAKKRAFKTLELGTANSSIHQLALYQKCGFRIVGIDAHFFLRHYDEAIYENGIQAVDMIRLSQDLT
ncbi:acetyltransferase, GNAT family [Bacillus sp. JCM 19046]|uniref:Ribosomal protein S18 acetylase RimI-like enzyme n=1 Tax=Shouchella xiaoxiensis TaxID=766895 RepID=A0ABS2SPW8_9BACI|nr:GNAT family N-acetyltransferase [Shouchella xiaoxiensis]MBM7837290.1 ribosomal protein S18 acetylase RimI-like enzyme [Shouchella xiaoxiensis]GAF11479.1 acetyltransferase, GNAT family [Bacillus sp. JCM 19045]GAF16942.1 acetyltransferase, GNAT family [Bacillus sp. JCM 19046]